MNVIRYYLLYHPALANLLKKIAGRVHYANGYVTLPPPLKPDEEQEYIRALDQGESYAVQKLIEHNLRLVVYIAKRFENTGIAADDLISIGSIGLIKAINTFRSDKNIKLATYASRCIENDGQKAEVSLDEPLNIDWDGNELLLSDILGTDSDSVSKNLEEDIEKQILHNALERIPLRERMIMEMRFGLGGYREMTQKEVADVLGISQSYISRLEKKIISRLRREIEKSL